jgi:uncharacterized membrane protein YdjX (TVP38/TMEM64 family)
LAETPARPALKRNEAISVQKSNAVKFMLLMLLAAFFLYIAYSSGLHDYVSQKAILALLENMGSFAPLGFMAVMALTVVSPLPSLPLDIAAGIFLDLIWVRFIPQQVHSLVR